MIPNSITAFLTSFLPDLYSRDTINVLFQEAGASGYGPRNWEKAGRVQAWCREINDREPERAEEILSRLARLMLSVPTYRGRERDAHLVAQQLVSECSDAGLRVKALPEPSRIKPTRSDRLRDQLSLFQEMSAPQRNRSVAALCSKVRILIDEELLLSSASTEFSNSMDEPLPSDIREQLEEIRNVLSSILDFLQSAQSAPAVPSSLSHPLRDAASQFAVSYADAAGKSLGVATGGALLYAVHAVLTAIGTDPIEALRILRLDK